MQISQEPVKNEIVRNKQGRFVKGAPSPNPLGLGLTNIKLNALFSRAFMQDKDKHKGKDLFEYAFEKAHTNNRVLIALLNKFVPDLLKGEGFGDRYAIFGSEGINSERVQRLVALLRERASEDKSAESC